jgi:hypothetical protein
MLEYLGENADQRRLRLFACACCRRIWPLMKDRRSKGAVGVAEAFADGKASDDQLHEARSQAEDAALEATYREPYDEAGELAKDAAEEAAARAERVWLDVKLAAELALKAAAAAKRAAEAKRAAAEAQLTAWGTITPSRRASLEADVSAAGAAAAAAEREAESHLLRCIFGNPFNPAPPIDPAVLQWNGSVVLKLAEAVYQERTFESLPILADALEEAGLTDAALLGHLRGPGPHAPGCWALDQLLGKE